MIKENIKSMLNKGATLDDIVIGILDILHETTSGKDNHAALSEFIASTINKLNGQIAHIKEQHQMGVHMDFEQPENEPVFPVQANADLDFSELEQEIISLELEEALIEEMEVIDREGRNNSKDVNKRAEFIATLHGIYDGFDIKGKPENSTFALYTSTAIN